MFKDGSIGIPDVGRVTLIGMTIDEAENTVFQALVRANIDPSVSLEIAEYQSQRVAIGGAVKSGAVLPVTQKPLTLAEGLGAVGGTTVTDRSYGAVRIYRDGTIYQIPLAEYDRRAENASAGLSGPSCQCAMNLPLDQSQHRALLAS